MSGTSFWQKYSIYLLLPVWLLITGLFGFWMLNYYEAGKEPGCAKEVTGSPLSAEIIGKPPADATLNAKLGIARGVAITSTSWPSGPNAPPKAIMSVSSSPLGSVEGGSIIRSDKITATLEIDAGTTILTVCIDGKDTDAFKILSHGKYAGFVAIATSDPGTTLTVRQQLSIQSAYVGLFWPFILVIVPLALALSSKIRTSNSPVAILIPMFAGAGAFITTYQGAALTNLTWGGLDNIGSLIAATFTATTGAVATASAATSSRLANNEAGKT